MLFSAAMKKLKKSRTHHLHINRCGSGSTNSQEQLQNGQHIHPPLLAQEPIRQNVDAENKPITEEQCTKLCQELHVKIGVINTHILIFSGHPGQTGSRTLMGLKRIIVAIQAVLEIGRGVLQLIPMLNGSTARYLIVHWHQLFLHHHQLQRCRQMHLHCLFRHLHCHRLHIHQHCLLCHRHCHHLRRPIQEGA